MLTVLAVIGVLVVIFFAAVFATREDQALVPEEGDRADVTLPQRPLRPSDIERVRFGVTVRGYRMSEVDDVLARLAAELAERDRRIDELSGPTELAPQPSAIGASSMLTAPTEADVTPPPAVPVAPATTPAASAQTVGSSRPESARATDPRRTDATGAPPAPASPDVPGMQDEVHFPDVLPADPAGGPERTDRD